MQRKKKFNQEKSKTMMKFNAKTDRKLELLRAALNKWHEKKEFIDSSSLIPKLYQAAACFWCKNNIIKA